MIHCSLKSETLNKRKIKKNLLNWNFKFNWIYDLSVKVNLGGCIPFIFERRRMLQEE